MAPLRDAATLREEQKDGALKGRRYIVGGTERWRP